MSVELDHERRVLWLAAAGALPAIVAAIVFAWSGEHSSGLRWTLTLGLPALALLFAAAVRRRVAFPLQTLANLLEALREGDFSMRARRGRDHDSLGEVMREVNTLGAMLRAQRLGALEATALLRRVMSEIDVAVFSFDESGRLRLVNRAGERLLGQPAERLLGRAAAELELEPALGGESHRTLAAEFPGGRGPWALRRSTFREGGAPHQLVVLADLSRALREEERQAWQRLIRVLGHELNNSLAPIQSMAQTLRSLYERSPRASDWEADMTRGLQVIGDRAESLGRFVTAYGQLARLPRPTKREVDVEAWISRVAALERRLPVVVDAGPPALLAADRDQLDQLLINLVRNGVDAALETGGGVRVGWRIRRDGGRGELEVTVEDDGPGLPNTANLFVPFFTTKPEGSGIGLVLSRQIAEAHDGSLTLAPRRAARGSIATLRLPLEAAA
jgi:PAS domain S-box-containing protein